MMSVIKSSPFWLLLLLSFVCAFGSKRGGKVSKVEQRLMDDLLQNVSKIARPVARNDLPVVVDFEMKLGKLIQLDIKDQVMVGSYLILMRWYNPHLQWDKKDYNGTDYINLPSNLIWTPDIMLHNTAVRQSQAPADIYKTNVIVKNTGVAIWMSPVTLEASCSINIRWFPFDIQQCELDFGSRSYTKKKLKLRLFRELPSEVDVKAKKHYSSGHWTIIEMNVLLDEESFECCDDPFTMIKYRLKWRRLSMYWVLYLVLPCLFLSFLALFSFFIPAETGERTGFGITTVLAMSVYLLVISDKLPEKSDVSPAIGVLYTILFFITSAALLSVIITTHLAFKTTKPSATLKRFLQVENSICKTRVKPAKGKKNKIEGSTTDICIKDYAAKEFEKKDDDDVEVIELQGKVKDGGPRASGEKKQKYQEEWKEIAQKLDQLLFRFFLILTVFVLSVAIIAFYS